MLPENVVEIWSYIRFVSSSSHAPIRMVCYSEYRPGVETNIEANLSEVDLHLPLSHLVTESRGTCMLAGQKALSSNSLG
jgi:hypothetical protein